MYLASGGAVVKQSLIIEIMDEQVPQVGATHTFNKPSHKILSILA